MKIIKRVGERLLPSWLRTELRSVLAFTGAGSALCSGSVVLARLAWTRLSEHLDWRERLGAIAAVGYIVVYGCAHAPDVAKFAVPGVVLGWCVAAWSMSPPTAIESEQQAPASIETPLAHSHEDVRAATLDWIWQQVGDRQGVHLRDLLAHAQAHGMFEALDVSEFRTHLERHRISVRNRVRVRGLGVTVGIHRDDLPPLPEPLPDSDPPEPPDSELHTV